MNLFLQVEEEKIEEASAPYNVTACCVEANLNSVCLPLCSYNANMNDIKRLAVCGSGMNWYCHAHQRFNHNLKSSIQFFDVLPEVEAMEAAVVDVEYLAIAFRYVLELLSIL